MFNFTIFRLVFSKKSDKVLICSPKRNKHNSTTSRKKRKLKQVVDYLGAAVRVHNLNKYRTEKIVFVLFPD